MGAQPRPEKQPQNSPGDWTLKIKSPDPPDRSRGERRQALSELLPRAPAPETLPCRTHTLEHLGTQDKHEGEDGPRAGGMRQEMPAEFSRWQGWRAGPGTETRGDPREEGREHGERESPEPSPLTQIWHQVFFRAGKEPVL